MRTRSVVLGFLVTGVLLCAPPPGVTAAPTAETSKPIMVGPEDNGKHIALPVGSQLQVRLYRPTKSDAFWQPVGLVHLRLVSQAMLPPPVGQRQGKDGHWEEIVGDKDTQFLNFALHTRVKDKAAGEWLRLRLQKRSGKDDAKAPSWKVYVRFAPTPPSK